MKRFHGIGSKDAMIKDAESKAHQFLTDEQCIYTKDGKQHTTHQFYHYKSYEEYEQIHEHKNRHAFEVINSECKLYFDIEYYESKISTPATTLFWCDIIPSIQTHYEKFYGMVLDKDDLFVSGTKPRSEKETIKWSFHIVINNGYFVKSNRDVVEFIKYIKDNEENPDISGSIDIVPYQKNQSFKLPHQSKINSAEYPQNIIKGEGFKNHLVKRYSHDEFKGYYKQVIAKQSSIKNFTKKETVNKQPTILDVGEIITEVDGLVKGSLKDPLAKKLTKLGNDDLEWATYFSVMCAIKNVYPNTDGKALFINWAKISSKFIHDYSKKEWDSLTPRKNARTLKTIDDLLKKKYPNEYRDENELVNSITQVTLDVEKLGYQKQTINTRYCSDEIDLYKLFQLAPKKDMFEIRDKPYTDILLKSHLGTGKSTIIKHLIKKHKFESILVISPRVMFGNSIYSEFLEVEYRFKFYKEIKKEDRIKHDFMVCQLESLTTLKDKYQLVILDEIESILNQFHSSTMTTNIDKISLKFHSILTNAKFVVSADAFIMDRSVDVLNTIRPNKHKLYIENIFNPYKRTCFKMGNNSDKLTKCLLNDINKYPKDRRVIITGSRPHSDTLHEAIRDTGQTSLKLNRFTDDKLSQEIRDVDTMWAKYQNVVYTSTITVGVSYNPAIYDKHFDKLFINFSVNGANVRDMFQASLRARILKKNQLFYTIYDRFMQVNYQEDDTVLLRTFEELYNWKKENVSNRLSDWLLKIWAYNELEKVVNRMYFKQVVDKYLQLCGYTSYLLPIEKITVDKDINKHGLYDYNEIDADYTECEDIYKLICSGGATTLDKIKYLKYDFEVNVLGIDHGLCKDTLKNMFDNYQQNPAMIHTIHEGYLVENKKHTTVSYYTDNIIEKKEFITGLNAVLGIENSYSDCEIKRDVLKEVAEYFKNKNGEMKRLFMFDTHKHFDTFSEKGVIGTLNTIYTEYIGMSLRFGERKRKRIDGKVVDVTPIQMSPYQKIEKKQVVFDMTGFVKAFRKQIFTAEEEDDVWYPSEYVLRNVPGDDI